MACMLVFRPDVSSQTIVVNEFMSSNGSVMADDFNNYEDWIEFHNYGDDVVPLKGFFLSDDYSNPYKWMFPDVSIEPGQYLLVWASGKDRTDPDAPLHTNFSISRTGEEIIFTHPSGERLDEIGPVNLPRDVSLARYPNGTGSWFYNFHPTPGVENQPLNTEYQVVAFWLMNNNLPNNVPLQAIEPTFSLLQEDTRIQYHSSLEGYPYEPGHSLWRKASMERRNLPTPLNYQPAANSGQSYAQSNMRGLQIKQPFQWDTQENMIVLHIPSTGFTDISLGFAAIDEGAADSLIIDYSIAPDSNESWIPVSAMHEAYSVGPGYQLYAWDFSEVPEANNNPFFRVRIRFAGNNLSADDGNRVTFNNFSVHAKPLAMHHVNITTGKGGLVSPYGFNRAFTDDQLDIMVFPTRHHIIDQFLVNDADRVAELEELSNNTAWYQLKNIKENTRIHVTFRLDDEYIAGQKDGILVYPNPSKGNITIKADGRMYSVTVRNVAGITVYESTMMNTHEHSFVLPHIPGFYALLINHDRGVTVKKLQVVY